MLPQHHPLFMQALADHGEVRGEQKPSPFPQGKLPHFARFCIHHFNLRHSGYEPFQVSCFLFVCACKHHILISGTRLRSYAGFKNADFGELLMKTVACIRLTLDNDSC